MSETKPLSMDLIVTDAETQVRFSLNGDALDDYTDAIQSNGSEWPLGPLDVFCDGAEYFLADGFHRFFAAKNSNQASVPCRVHQGTARDARIFAMTANDRNGLRLTRAEKRACVEELLDAENMTQEDIAKAVGVTTRTVRNVVRDRKISATPMGGSEAVETTEEQDAPLQDAPWATDTDEPQETGPPTPRNGKDERGAREELAMCELTEEEADYEKQFKLQQKATLNYLKETQRAIDRLHELMPCQGEWEDSIEQVQYLMRTVEDWK